jgi:hypothetical protein
VAIGSWSIVTLGYFIKCRTEFDKKVAQNKELGDIMNMIIKYRGTDLEPKLQQKYNEKLQEIDKKSKYI